MIRELFVAAAITGAAIAVAPVAAGDPPHYDGDVPGMNYAAELGAPCDNYERFIFGRGPDGQAEACHFITHQFPAAQSGYWVLSFPLYGVQDVGAPCADHADLRGSVAQSPDGLPLTCTQAHGWVVGQLTTGGYPVPGGGLTDTGVTD